METPDHRTSSTDDSLLDDVMDDACLDDFLDPNNTGLEVTVGNLTDHQGHQNILQDIVTHVTEMNPPSATNHAVSAPRGDDVIRHLFASACEWGDRKLFSYIRASTDIHDLIHPGDPRLVPEAAARGDCDILEGLLEMGLTCDARDEQGFTALHLAVQGGHEGTAALLLRAGACPDSRTHAGYTPLILACMEGRPRLVALLMDYEASADVTGPDDVTVVQAACINDNAEVLRTLRERRVDILRDGTLSMAVHAHRRSVLRLLLDPDSPQTSTEKLSKSEEDMDPIFDVINTNSSSDSSSDTEEEFQQFNYITKSMGNIQLNNKAASTLCHKASKRGDIPMLSYLMSDASCSFSDARGFSLLHTAARYGQKETARFLLNDGANVNAKTDAGESPLFVACAEGHEELVDLLLTSGALPDEEDCDGQTPLQAACVADHIGVFRTYQNHSLYSSMRGIPYYAACYGRTEILLIGLISELKNQFSSPDNSERNNTEADADCRWSPLHGACYYGQYDTAEYLLMHGRWGVDSRHTCGETPLHVACAGGNLRIVSLLLSHGADVNAVTDVGENALFYSMTSSDTSLIDILCERDCNTEIVNIYGRNLVVEAIESVNIDMLKKLLSLGCPVQTDKHCFDSLRFHFYEVFGTSRKTVVQFGESALHAACRLSLSGVVSLLLTHGANVNVCFVGETPLHVICRNHDLLTFRHLVNAGADLHAHGARWEGKNEETPFRIMCRTGWVEATQYLMSSHPSRLFQLSSQSSQDISALLSSPSLANMVLEKLLTDLRYCIPAAHNILAALLTMNEISSHNVKLLASGDKKEILQIVQNNVTMHVVILYGKPQVLALLLDCGMDVDTQFSSGDTCLHAAIHNVEKVELLLQRGARPDLKNQEGYDALAWACHWGDPTIRELLLTAYISTGRHPPPASVGRSALEVVHLHGDHEGLIRLLHSGLYNSVPTLSRCLCLSFGGIIPEMAETLLHHGADTNTEVAEGLTALDGAVVRGDVGMVCLLLEHGAEPTARVMTSLVRMVGSNQLTFSVSRPSSSSARDLLGCILLGSPRLAPCLTEALLDPCVSGELRLELARVAITEWDLDLVQALVLYGMNPHNPTESGEYLLHLACEADWEELCRYLLVDLKVTPNPLDCQEASPLCVATKHANRSVVRLLLEAGARPHPHRVERILSAALHKGGPTLVDMFLEYKALSQGDLDSMLTDACLGKDLQRMHKAIAAGASVNCAVYGEPLLHMACRYGNPEVVGVLLEAGADRDRTCPVSGATALHVACVHSGVEMTEALLRYKVNTNIQDLDGLTPLRMALSNNRLDQCKFLCHSSGKCCVNSLGIQGLVEMLSEEMIPVMVDCGLGMPFLLVSLVAGESQIFSGILETNILDLSEVVDYLKEYVQLEGINPMSHCFGQRLHVLRKILMEESGISILHLVCAANYNADGFQSLLDHGADINAETDSGLSVLVVAIVFGKFKFVKSLVAVGVLIKSQLPNGATLLDCVFMKRKSKLRYKLIKLLISGGMDAGVCVQEGKPFGDLFYDLTESILKRKKKNYYNGNNNSSSDECYYVHFETCGMNILHLMATTSLPCDIKFASLLIEKGADVNACDMNGCSPLHLALMHKRFRYAIFLMRNGADLVGGGGHGEVSPLQVAVYLKQLPMIQAMIEEGLDVTEPLMNMTGTRILCNKCVNYDEVDASDMDTTDPTHSDDGTCDTSDCKKPGAHSGLTMFATTEVCEECQESTIGTDLNLPEFNNISILLLAVRGYFKRENVKIFHAIYNLKIQDTLTYLYHSACDLALRIGNGNFLRGFIKHKEILMSNVMSPYTVLVGVQSGLPLDLLRLLLAYVDLEQPLPFGTEAIGLFKTLLGIRSPTGNITHCGRNVYHIITDEETVNFIHFVEKCGNISPELGQIVGRELGNMVDREGKTLLHAAYVLESSAVHFLVCHDVNAVTDSGDSVLDHALPNSNWATIEILLNHNLNPNVTIDSYSYCGGLIQNIDNAKIVVGERLLHLIAQRFWGETDQGRRTTCILNKGAAVNALNMMGYTPIHLACLYGNVIVLYQLLEAGAALELDTETDSVPHVFDMAAISGCPATVGLLLDHGMPATHTLVVTRSLLNIPNTVVFPDHVRENINRLMSYKCERMSLIHLYCEGYFGTDPIFLEYVIDRGGYVNEENSAGFCPLHISCHRGWVRTASLLLHHGADVHKEARMQVSPTSCERLSALNVALAGSCPRALVELLLENGASVNQSLKDSATVADCMGERSVMEGTMKTWEYRRCSLLHLACEHILDFGEDFVCYLLDKGADIHAPDYNGLSALHIIVKNARDCSTVYNRNWSLKVLKEFLKHGLDPNTRLKHVPPHVMEDCVIELEELAGNTLLHLACLGIWQNTDVLEFSVQNGAQLDVTNAYGFTPVQLACLLGNINISHRLITLGACTAGAFDMAAICGCPDSVRLMLDHGMPATHTLVVTSSVLNIPNTVVFPEHVREKINRLMSYKCERMSLLHLYCEGYFGTDPAFLEYVIEKGGDVNEENSAGFCPLHISCRHGFFSTTFVLLHHGADMHREARMQVTSTSCESLSALNAALAGPFPRALVELLLENGASVNQSLKDSATVLGYMGKGSVMEGTVKTWEYRRCSLLHLTCERILDFGEDFVCYLLDKGADIHAPDYSGLSALHIIVKNGRDCSTVYKRNWSLKVLKEFLKHGLDPNTRLKHVPPHLMQETQISADCVLELQVFAGNTLLHLACLGIWHHTDVLEVGDDFITYLLGEGADVDATNSYGLTPLHIACLNEEWNLVCRLLNHRVTIQSTSENPLFPRQSLGNQSFKIAWQSLDNFTANQKTITELGENTGHFDLLRLAVYCASDVDIQCAEGRTPLYLACAADLHDVVSDLLSRGADVNLSADDGTTPLTAACTRHHRELIPKLASHMFRQIQNSAFFVNIISDFVSILLDPCIGNIDAPWENENTRLLDLLSVYTEFGMMTDKLQIKNDDSFPWTNLVFFLRSGMLDWPSLDDLIPMLASAEKPAELLQLLISGSTDFVGKSRLAKQKDDVLRLVDSVVAEQINEEAANVPSLVRLVIQSIRYFLRKATPHFSILPSISLLANCLPVSVVQKLRLSDGISAIFASSEKFALNFGDCSKVHLWQKQVNNSLESSNLHLDPLCSLLPSKVVQCQSFRPQILAPLQTSSAFKNVPIPPRKKICKSTRHQYNYEPVFINTSTESHIDIMDGVKLSQATSGSGKTNVPLEQSCVINEAMPQTPRCEYDQNIEPSSDSDSDGIYSDTNLPCQAEEFPDTGGIDNTYMRKEHLQLLYDDNRQINEMHHTMFPVFRDCSYVQTHFRLSLHVSDLITQSEFIHVKRNSQVSKKYEKVATQFVQSIQQTLSNKYALTFNCDPVLSGSVSHNTKVGFPDEFDFILMLHSHITDAAQSVVGRVGKFEMPSDEGVDESKLRLMEVFAELSAGPLRRPDNPHLGAVYIQAYHSYTRGPGVCVQLAHYCDRDHKHVLSIDITPACGLRYNLGEYLKSLDHFKVVPFSGVLTALKDTDISVVQVIHGHDKVKEWTLAVNDITKALYLNFGSNYPVLYHVIRWLKYVKDVMFLKVAKCRVIKSQLPGSNMTDALISSYTLQHLVWGEVKKYPLTSDWSTDKIHARLASILVALKQEEYFDLYFNRNSPVINATSHDKILLRFWLNRDIDFLLQIIHNMSKHFLSSSPDQIRAITKQFEEEKGKVYIVTGMPSLKVTTHDRLVFCQDDVRRKLNFDDYRYMYYYDIPDIPHELLNSGVFCRIVENIVKRREFGLDL